MNAVEIRNRITALQTRAAKINTNGLDRVIDMHMDELDEILSDVKPEKQEWALGNLNKDIDETEKTLVFHESKVAVKTAKATITAEDIEEWTAGNDYY